MSTPDNRIVDIEDADEDTFDPEDEEGEYLVYKPLRRDASFLVDRR